MESVISIIGSIASIFGAIWALREARKAKNAAEKAERLRNEIINRRKMVEVSQVFAETRRILTVVGKIGPSCNAKLLRGVNCADIAMQVNEYVSYLLEQSEHFSNSIGNKAKVLCNELRSDIENLSEAISFEDKKKYGKSIYYKILDFKPMVKQLSDEKQERALND